MVDPTLPRPPALAYVLTARPVRFPAAVPAPARGAGLATLTAFLLIAQPLTMAFATAFILEFNLPSLPVRIYVQSVTPVRSPVMVPAAIRGLGLVALRVVMPPVRPPRVAGLQVAVPPFPFP